MTNPVLANVLAFSRALRVLGFRVDAERTVRALAALEAVGFEHPDDAREALKAVWVTRREEDALFDTAWQQFLLMLGGWGDHPLAGRTLLADVARQRFMRQRQPQVIWAGAASPGEGRSARDEDDSTPMVVLRGGASPLETLRHKDFAALTEAERREMERWAARAAWPLWRRSRRWRRWKSGRRWDIGATLRRRLTGSEMIRLVRRARRYVPRPIVMLLDVSGSMEPYSRMALRFARSLQGAGRPLEVFVLSTRLHRVTEDLQKARAERALRRVWEQTAGMGGGTRLARSIGDFNRGWARRVMRGGATTVIVSDGLDSDNPAELEREMVRLARFSRMIVWLHPSLSRKDYRPEARGMAAALPYVDHFLPGGIWAELEEAWRLLQRAGSGQKVRQRQRNGMKRMKP